MMPMLRNVCVFALCASFGCAGSHQMSPRAANTLIGVGTLVTTVGILAAAGCPDLSSAGNGCGQGPSDPNLAAGLPMIAVGAGMVTAGALGRRGARGPSMAKRGKTQAPTGWWPTPKPAQPDPFVPPLTPL